MTADILVGGTAEDRAALMAKFNAYLVANDDMDWEALQSLFSPAPETVFFNLNGNTYRGREHWTRLWQYYKTRVRNGVWEPFDLGGMVSADLAVIWCHRKTAYKWIGDGPLDAGRKPERRYESRSTMVFRKEGGDWRVVHVHFSPVSEDPRPGGV